MLKKLKRKFVIINMCLVGIVLLAAFAAVCINSYQKAHEEVVGALHMALENTKEDKPALFVIGSPTDGDRIGNIGEEKNENTQSIAGQSEASQSIEEKSEEGKYETNQSQTTRSRLPAQSGFAGKPFSYAAVVLLVNDDNGTRQVTTLGMTNASMNEDVINEAVEAVMASGEDRGKLADMELFYMKNEDFHGTKIAFADSTYFDEDMRKTVFTAAVIFIAVMTALFFISLFLANVAVSPVKKAWEKQRRFVADASHELKTPLTVLLANNEIMLSALDDMESSRCGAEPEINAGKVFAVCDRRLTDDIIDMRRWLESSREEAMQMKGLVDDLLFLARADEADETASGINAAADKKIAMADVDISDVVTGAALQMEPVAFEAGVNMTTDVEAKIHMKCDAAQMKQLVHILLDNAVKYCGDTSVNGVCGSESGNCSDGGKVLLDLRKTADNIVLTVANTGEVIDSEDIEHIFDRFYQSDKARSGNGYGLGLSIAKTIVESHGGTIRAYSGVLGSEVCEKLKRTDMQNETSTENPTGTVMTVVF